jgi:hypothetical protein
MTTAENEIAATLKMKQDILDVIGGSDPPTPSTTLCALGLAVGAVANATNQPAIYLDAIMTIARSELTGSVDELRAAIALMRA